MVNFYVMYYFIVKKLKLILNIHQKIFDDHLRNTGKLGKKFETIYVCSKYKHNIYCNGYKQKHKTSALQGCYLYRGKEANRRGGQTAVQTHLKS